MRSRTRQSSGDRCNAKANATDKCIVPGGLGGWGGTQQVAKGFQGRRQPKNNRLTGPMSTSYMRSPTLLRQGERAMRMVLRALC
jgi:hypothetical protein